MEPAGMIILALVITNMICAGIAATIYDKKGLNWIAGALVGLMFGPIGLMVAVSQDTDVVLIKHREEKQFIDSGKYVRCPLCLEVIRKQVKVCPRCCRPVTKE